MLEVSTKREERKHKAKKKRRSRGTKPLKEHNKREKDEQKDVTPRNNGSPSSSRLDRAATLSSAGRSGSLLFSNSREILDVTMSSLICDKNEMSPSMAPLLGQGQKSALVQCRQFVDVAAVVAEARTSVDDGNERGRGQNCDDDDDDFDLAAEISVYMRKEGKLMQSVKRVSLAGVNVKRVPDALCVGDRFMTLRILDASHAGIASLPRELGDLKTLRELYASHNLLTALPAEIAKLPLEVLDVSFNRIGAIVPSVAQLRKLETLNMRGNALVNVPEWCVLPALLCLDVRDNPIALFNRNVMRGLVLKRPRCHVLASQDKRALGNSGGGGQNSLIVALAQSAKRQRRASAQANRHPLVSQMPAAVAVASPAKTRAAPKQTDNSVSESSSSSSTSDDDASDEDDEREEDLQRWMVQTIADDGDAPRHRGSGARLDNLFDFCNYFDAFKHVAWLCYDEEERAPTFILLRLHESAAAASLDTQYRLLLRSVRGDQRAFLDTASIASPDAVLHSGSDGELMGRSLRNKFARRKHDLASSAIDAFVSNVSHSRSADAHSGSTLAGSSGGGADDSSPLGSRVSFKTAAALDRHHVNTVALLRRMVRRTFVPDAVLHELSSDGAGVMMALEQALNPTLFDVGVVCVPPGGAKTRSELIGHVNSSESFERFLRALGEKVPLKGWLKYAGGLDVNGAQTGTHSIFAESDDGFTMFHVAPWITSLPLRASLIARDLVVVAFVDDDTDSATLALDTLVASHIDASNALTCAVLIVRPCTIDNNASSSRPSASAAAEKNSQFCEPGYRVSIVRRAGLRATRATSLPDPPTLAANGPLFGAFMRRCVVGLHNEARVSPLFVDVERRYRRRALFAAAHHVVAGAKRFMAQQRVSKPFASLFPADAGSLAASQLSPRDAKRHHVLAGWHNRRAFTGRAAGVMPVFPGELPAAAAQLANSKQRRSGALASSPPASRKCASPRTIWKRHADYFANDNDVERRALPTLDHVLRSPSGRAAFTKFLESERSAEHMRFLDAAARFRGTSEARRAELAADIVSRFIDADGASAVNIADTLRSSVDVPPPPAVPPIDTFDACVESVHDMLRLDPFKRFLDELISDAVENDASPSSSSSPPSRTSGARHKKSMASLRRAAVSRRHGGRSTSVIVDRSLDELPQPPSSLLSNSKQTQHVGLAGLDLASK
jgi:Leucine-rich repeat (LRR) protein